MPEHSQASCRQLMQTSQDVLCLFSALFSQKTWHRLVPLPFSYMQMSIIEVAESGELCCTSACGWCLPERRAKPMKRESQPSVGKTHLNIMWARQCQTEKESFFLSFFLSFFFFLSFCPSWVTWPAGYMGHVFTSSPVLVMGGFFFIAPRPLSPAVLLGKYSTLGTEQLHHCCHREHLVITSRAQPPAEFTEPSASPMTRLCLCMSLLETLDMLNTPIRPGTKFSFFHTQHLPQKIVCSQRLFAPTRVHTHKHTRTQTNFNLRIVGNVGHLRSLCRLVPERLCLCHTVSQAVCHRRRDSFQKHWALSVWITAVYICIMPVIMG